MENKKTCHSCIYWKKRIEEIVIQYNLLSQEKINFSIIEKRIGNDFDKAIKEYVSIQNQYIKFVKENFFDQKRRRKKKCKNKKRRSTMHDKLSNLG